MEEFPASKVHLQPATWLTGKFPCRRMSRHHCPLWVWYKGEIHPYRRMMGAGISQIAQTSYSRHQIKSDNLNCQFPSNILGLLQGHILIFLKSPSQQKFAWKTEILRNRSIGCPQEVGQPRDEVGDWQEFINLKESFALELHSRLFKKSTKSKHFKIAY